MGIAAARGSAFHFSYTSYGPLETAYLPKYFGKPSALLYVEARQGRQAGLS